MPLHGVLSSVRPSSFVAGQGRGRFNFSAYLGNNSKAGKYYRLLQEVQSHMRLRLWSDKNELRQQYIPALTRRLIEPLLKSGAAGVEEVMELMDCYYLTKEDWDVVMELGVGPGSFEVKAQGLPTQVKSGFTRQYNAASHPVPFMKRDVGSAVAVKSTDKPDLEDVIEDDPEPEDEDESKSEEPDLTKDKYVKIAKPKGAKAAGAKKAATKARAKAKASAK
jgi:replication factor C subunit 1